MASSMGDKGGGTARGGGARWVFISGGGGVLKAELRRENALKMEDTERFFFFPSREMELLLVMDVASEESDSLSVVAVDAAEVGHGMDEEEINECSPADVASDVLRLERRDLDNM